MIIEQTHLDCDKQQRTRNRVRILKPSKKTEAISSAKKLKNGHISGPNGGYFVYHPSNVFCKLVEKNVYRYS